MIKRVKRYYYIIINLLKFSLHSKVNFGKKMRCVGAVDLDIKSNASLQIGNGFNLVSGNMINPLGRNIKSSIRIDENAKIVIGDNVGISCAALRAKKGIYIGNNVNIGADVIILDTDSHSLNFMERRDFKTDRMNTKSSEVFISDDVFIGVRSLILKGVTIGPRSIVAAGSVVVKSIPADEIWGGNPATFIKKNR